MFEEFKHVAGLLAFSLQCDGYELVADQESETKYTGEFFNRENNHRVFVKLVEGCEE